jgi:hypothetical protein
MNYAVELAYSATVYIPSFIQIGSAIEDLIKKEYTYT